MAAAILRAVMMCHAPIVIPAIGGPRARQCAATTTAMAQTARALLQGDPELLVVLTPHGPRQERAWGAFEGPVVHGDFGRFGQPGLRYHFDIAQGATRALQRTMTSAGVDSWLIRDTALDHGALVPLHFVAEAGWTGPLVLLSVPWDASKAVDLGHAIATTASALGARWSVLASGDMSHRLMPGAPSGYHARAREFDAALSEAVARGDLRAAASIPPDLRELAAEDAVDTLTVAAAAVGWDPTGSRFFCYEGPFGVGYMEALLHAAP